RERPRHDRRTRRIVPHGLEERIIPDDDRRVGGEADARGRETRDRAGQKDTARSRVPYAHDMHSPRRPSRSLLLAIALPVSTVLFGCASSGPPAERGAFRAPDLVELIVLDATIHLDIRYSTPDNIVHRPVYREARAFLQRPAAEALVRAHRALAEKGFG